MPFYRFGAMVAHVKMTNTRKRPAPAQCRAPFTWPDGSVKTCCAMSTKLCDQVVGHHDDGTEATCDMPICDEHATSIGEDLDLCPKHAAERKCPPT